MNWIAIIVAGLATYLSRVSFIAVGDKIQLPGVIESALRYVAPAAFAAISVPIVLGGDGLADLYADIPRIVAAAAACAIVYKTRNVAASLAVGMGSLWLLIWVL